MENYADFFEDPGEPADDVRIADIERAIGRRLPEDYRALIQETGGGSLKLSRCVMPGLPGAAEGLSTDNIFGNGKIATGANVDLAEFGVFLMEEWEIPEEVLLFADTEDGMHNCFVINYDLAEFPRGAILHLDTDPGGKLTKVADSVADFLNALEPYNDEGDQDYNPSAGQEGVGIKGVWHGVLSETLTRAIAEEGVRKFVCEALIQKEFHR
ncbi:SMI1/KNR4 family protein [Corynebacterium yudongzhengii]|uniref:SMI1/KNR4 family protein n=1 Tax=Corynebacterium yudongzhengii TaxID=2080740 RepID=UPI0013047D44|nr:SMI1/KNR4 family protein [Corynebacterium yudongzhengii]